MRSHIDWITFTMTPIYKSAYVDMSPDAMFQNALVDAFIFTFGESLTSRAFGGIWTETSKGRAPYTQGWKLSDGDITLFGSPELNHYYVEISGKGCEKLIALGLLDDVLLGCKSRVTRIDLAVDMQTEITPTEFVAGATGKRTKSNGYQISASGETCYVGSQKSERYARVYRYNKPHPRAHLLRAEHVFRREIAREVAHAIASGGLLPAVRKCGDLWGWSNDCWDIAAGESADLRVAVAQRDSGKTVFWLVSSVAPAFKKLLRNGTIVDGEEFLRRYFFLSE